MKQTLESLLEYGRTAFDATTNEIRQTKIKVDIDYKIILQSNYISKRILELSSKPLEISFIYGGTVSRNQDKTTLNINGLYIPHTQRISEGDFSCSPESSNEATVHFARENKRIVGIGHSHAGYDVFHSATDISNYQQLVGSMGVRIDHKPSYVEQVAKTYYSTSSRLHKAFAVTKQIIKKTQSTFSYMLPSLVFNAKGQSVDAIIAQKKYAIANEKMETAFSTQDCNLRIYNKQATLTSADKKMLDFAIYKVLSYNRLLRERT